MASGHPGSAWRAEHAVCRHRDHGCGVLHIRRYERFFIRDGQRYHHILDPATGKPAMRSRSVTIMAKSATVSNGLSTGVFILGAEKGMALIERLEDVEGVIVTADNEVKVSSGLEGRLAQLSAPTP